jgi:hypothetical protein
MSMLNDKNKKHFQLFFKLKTFLFSYLLLLSQSV